MGMYACGLINPRGGTRRVLQNISSQKTSCQCLDNLCRKQHCMQSGEGCVRDQWEPGGGRDPGKYQHSGMARTWSYGETKLDEITLYQFIKLKITFIMKTFPFN
jgi:hypothetical protein